MLDLLRKVPTFEGLTDEQLDWFISHCEDLHVNAGEVIIAEGSPADRLFVLLEGECQGRSESDAASGMVYGVRAGSVTGMLPFSRMTEFTITMRALVPSHLLCLRKDQFPEMLHQIPILGERLVGIMADRIRNVTKQDQQRDKLMALGKLSAGLAHELNNPAAAAKRASATLQETLATLRGADRNLALHELTCVQWQCLSDLEAELIERARSAPVRGTLELSDLEEKLATWLESRIQDPWRLVSLLAEADLNLEDLERLASCMDPQAFEDALLRLTARLSSAQLALDIENSVSRIVELVKAVKEYSYMDQAPIQCLDVHKGIDSTLTILGHRLKAGIRVAKQYDPNLPRIEGYGGELNQVWTNLIDNAIDAMSGKGDLTIRTCPEPSSIVVQITDSGPGIPLNVQPHIFDPFFTTKGVGEGTGLGLDTVYRIVSKHRGSIRFETQPGKTCFEVRLPISQTAAPQ